MNYCFTEQPVEGYVHRNPKYWAISTPPTDAKSVIIGKGYPAIKEHFRAKDVEIVVLGASEEITRDSIPKMKRKDVIEHLKARGASVEDCKGVSLAGLRKKLTETIFVGL